MDVTEFEQKLYSFVSIEFIVLIILEISIIDCLFGEELSFQNLF